MTRFLSIFCGSVLLSGAALAIDLTPRFLVNQLDGPPIRRPYFTDGEKKYAVTIDQETELIDYEGSALFNFQKFPRAAMRLRQSPLKVANPFDEVNLPRYREAALKLVMQGAEKAVIEQELPEVLPINEWQSHRFVIGYEIAGVKMCESITFLNITPKDQIILQIRAREGDFVMITTRAEDIVRRWHEVRPGTEVTGN